MVKAKETRGVAAAGFTGDGEDSLRSWLPASSEEGQEEETSNSLRGWLPASSKGCGSRGSVRSMAALKNIAQPEQ